MQEAASAKLGCFWMVLLLILLFAAAPMISVMLSISLAEHAGCTIHEGAANTCVILGNEMGGLLYAMFVAGWLSFITLPSGLIALLIWLIAAVFLWIKRRSRPTTQQHSDL